MIVRAPSITVYDDRLVFGAGRRSVAWQDIVGLKKCTEPFFQAVSRAFPRAKLFLRDGRAVAIPSTFRLSVRCGGEERDYAKNHGENFARLMAMVEERAVCIEPGKCQWLEWRVVLPAGLIMQPLGLAAFLTFPQRAMRGDSSVVWDVCFLLMLVLGGVGLAVGYAWERRARRRFMGTGPS